MPRVRALLPLPRKSPQTLDIIGFAGFFRFLPISLKSAEFSYFCLFSPTFMPVFVAGFVALFVAEFVARFVADLFAPKIHDVLRIKGHSE